MMPELIFHQHAAELRERHAAAVVRRPDKEKGLPKIVGISGSASTASRTRSIVESAIGRIGAQTGGETHMVCIGDLVSDLGIAARSEASARVEEALYRIETADLLIVGSPIYKGSYTGLLKHLIDLVDYRALAGIPVGLIATGGSDKHALVVEHHMRPLFGFFSARTLATGLFIADRAIVDGTIEDAPTRTRLDQLIKEAVEALASVREAQPAGTP